MRKFRRLHERISRSIEEPALLTTCNVESALMKDALQVMKEAYESRNGATKFVMSNDELHFGC